MSGKLTSPSVLHELLRRHGVTPRRRWGQNFLIDENILRKIPRAAQIAPGDEVLEVGPGPGALTVALAQAGARVWAVELDPRLMGVLAETTAAYPQVHPVQADILTWPWSEHLAPERTKVVSNLPYYLISPLLGRLLADRFPLLVLLVQQEVAHRLLARPGQADYGSLSVRVAYHATGEIIARVSPGAFYPRPEVASAVVRLTRRPVPPVAVDEAALFAVVRAAFGHRRKTLRTALAQGLSLPAEKVRSLLAAAAIDGERRGETLTLEEFAMLAAALSRREVDPG